MLGISGLLALFLTILFVVKGTAMFPATAALAWAVLVYLCIDFGFWNRVIDDRARATSRSGAPAPRWSSPRRCVVFLFTYLNLNRWHVRYSHLAIGWLLGLVVLLGVAVDRAVGRRRASRASRSALTAVARLRRSSSTSPPTATTARSC